MEEEEEEEEDKGSDEQCRKPYSKSNASKWDAPFAGLSPFHHSQRSNGEEGCWNEWFFEV